MLKKLRHLTWQFRDRYFTIVMRELGLSESVRLHQNSILSSGRISRLYWNIQDGGRWVSLLRSLFFGCHATLPPKNSSRFFEGERDITKNGCEGDYRWLKGHVFVLLFTLRILYGLDTLLNWSVFQTANEASKFSSTNWKSSLHYEEPSAG